MENEQLEKAQEIKSQIYDLKKELKLWKEELTSPCRFGYLQSWNSNHAVKFENSIPKELFEGFRCAVMDSLKLKVIKLESMFVEL